MFYISVTIILLVLYYHKDNLCYVSSANNKTVFQNIKMINDYNLAV